jgi:hypothetical protein
MGITVSEVLTPRGVVFWPVGTGDSTTIVVDDRIVMQVDLHDMAKADDDVNPEVPVIDRLIEALPEGDDGRPYLAVFVLTHADKDHCLGFEDLLSKVTIGELWATPRLWREFDDAPDELCPDAQAFHAEADRRVTAIKEALAAGTEPGSGDRVLIIGYDTDHDDHAYSELPDRFLSGPGHAVTVLDGVDCSDRFEAFLHAPFKDDCAAARNDTSVAMQVTLRDGDGVGQFLLLGDLAYETIMKIFDYSTWKGRTDRLAWDVLLAPHHCSKKVMYVGDELKQDVLDYLEDNAQPSARVVSSSQPIPAGNSSGDNPPHRLAANRYQEIVDEFVCTMEHGSTETPEPVVFEVDTEGLHLVDPQVVEKSARSLAGAFGPNSGRLGKIAAAAALAALTYRAVKAAQTRPPGIDRVRAAVQEDRGGSSAPASVVGFGSL